MNTPVLLLHGAIGSSAQMITLKTEFEKHFPDVRVIDFPGHGGKEISEDFSIPFFAESVLKWMHENNLPSINIFGYSMGGYVALYLARHFPERIGKIITLGTKLEWNESIAEKETKLLNAEKIEEKVPQFAAELKSRHEPEDWKLVLKKTIDMMLQLGKSPALSQEDFSKINHPVILSLGELDKMVSVEETQEVNKLLKNSKFELIPATPHPIEKADPKIISEPILAFLRN